jgi:hypothetical protein
MEDCYGKLAPAKSFTYKLILSQASGEPVDAANLSDLKVIVLLGDADHSPDVHVPSTYENYSPIWGATEGKPGGGRPGDI